ncbi:COP9 signalosome complex subunit 3-like [Planoprotostelium fungivorum]|uniref:COP9 signalosome complex subunit 3 n=1 Tax=Planoprotostelium fungivorum TaxID=1890364 RepID=A0A2P6NE76_9EUKA|nr:COP9 signalosome complex subunit 3-like [Planoprotostelium fungivorum]
MDKLVANIQENSGTEGGLKQLKILLNKDDQYRQSPFLDEALNTLDPCAHSLGYTFLLGARSQRITDPQRFMNVAQEFFMSCNIQQVLCVIAQRFLELCVENNTPIRAVKPLQAAALKIRQSTETLTPVHAYFLQACLLSKCYHAALHLIDEDIFEVAWEKLNTPRDVLSYFYFAGMIYIGLKKYKKALAALRIIIVAPAQALSGIVVEGYKKYALLSLIVHGKVPPVAKTSSMNIQRAIKSAPAYQEFITAYGKHQADELHKVATTHAELFQKDKNFGLVKQCIQAQYRQSIQRATQTYLTLSLDELANTVNLNGPIQTQQLILRMIENGEIHAKINVRDSMISFDSTGEGYDTNDTGSVVDGRIQKVMSYARKVRVLDDTIAASTQFLGKSAQREGGRWGAGAEIDDDASGMKDVAWSKKFMS